jgi:hypothetical protein
MLTILNNILSKLPFNGKKSAIGFIGSLALYFWPDFPVPELEKILEYGANIYLLLGVLHKYVKAKLK